MSTLISFILNADSFFFSKTTEANRWPQPYHRNCCDASFFLFFFLFSLTLHKAQTSIEWEGLDYFRILNNIYKKKQIRGSSVSRQFIRVKQDKTMPFIFFQFFSYFRNTIMILGKQLYIQLTLARETTCKAGRLLWSCRKCFPLNQGAQHCRLPRQ